MSKYGYLISNAVETFTPQELTTIDSLIDLIPIKFLELFYKDGWRIEKNSNLIGAEGRTIPDRKVVQLIPRVIASGNDTLCHEFMHAYKFAYNNVYKINFVLDEKFNEAYDSEKPAIDNAGNTIWTYNREEFFAYITTAIILQKNMNYFDVAPKSKRWAENFVYASAPKVVLQLEDLKNNKVDDIVINSEQSTLEYYKNGVKTSLNLPAGGGSGNFLIDNTKDENSDIQTFATNAITYSYKDNQGSEPSILLKTFVDEMRTDFFQVKYLIGGQAGVTSSVVFRAGTRYGWDEWQELGGSGDIGLATGTQNGLMSKEDKTKLNSFPSDMASRLSTAEGEVTDLWSQLNVKIGHAKMNGGSLEFYARENFKLLTSVKLPEFELASIAKSGNNYNLSKAPRQKLGALSGTCSLVLPTTTEFCELHVFFTTGSTLPTLTLPSGVKWQNGTTPTLEANKTYEMIFTYIDGWIGGVVSYG